MLTTTIDKEIYIDFCKSSPNKDPFDYTKDDENWMQLWKFLKSGTDLIFVSDEEFDGQKAESRFITSLVSGRGDLKIHYIHKFNLPHRRTFPNDTFPGSYFMLDINNEVTQKDLLSKNGFLLGFKNNYKKTWDQLSLSGNKHHTFHIRRGGEGERFLQCWNDLSQFILPFTDIIISDRYINEQTIRDQNLLKFLQIIDNKITISYNLLIVTQKGGKKFLDEFESYLTGKIKELKLKAKLGIVLTSKEHDRCILMNYLKIESGDSFNYFSKGDHIITNGTELKLFPLCDKDNFEDAKVKLSALKAIVENEQDDKRGNTNNRLFQYCDCKNA